MEKKKKDFCSEYKKRGYFFSWIWEDKNGKRNGWGKPGRTFSAVSGGW